MWYGSAVELPNSVTTLEHEGTTYFVIGTAHVSQRSVDEVRQVIAEVKPDLVCGTSILETRLSARRWSRRRFC